MRFTRRAVTLGLSMAPLALRPSFAQDYPSRTITLVVPYPAGGGGDAIARALAERLSSALKQSVVVDNRGGGNGNVGTRSVATADPDGYTLLLGYTGTLAINPNLSKSAGYNVRRDLAPIGLFASVPVGIIAHPSFPAKSIAEFIALAKKQPGKISFGTGAVNTNSHLCALLFRMMADIDVTIVPYRGTAPVLNDLLGGHVPVASAIISPALGNIAAGKLRALAVTGVEPIQVLPDVPPVARSLPGFEAVTNFGLLAPAGTPAAIIQRLSSELRNAVSTDQIRDRIVSDAGIPIVSTPDDYAAVIEREDLKWSALIKKLGLEAD